MAALPLTDRISQSSGGKKDYRIIEAKFGNGYSQRAKDGINNIMGSWNIAWENITSAERDTIVAALDGTNGVDSLTWQSPDSLTVDKYVVTGYNISALSGDIYTITSSLKQIFDII